MYRKSQKQRGKAFSGLIFIFFVSLTPLLATKASSQVNTELDLSQIEEVLASAERAIAAPSVSVGRLSEHRKELEVYRGELFNLINEPNTLADRLRQQLDVLGPRPPAGEIEKEAISERRQSLESRLQVIEIQKSRNSEYYTLINDRISEIDYEISLVEAESIFSHSGFAIRSETLSAAFRQIAAFGSEPYVEIVESLKAIQSSSGRTSILISLALILLAPVTFFGLMRGKFSSPEEEGREKDACVKFLLVFAAPVAGIVLLLMVSDYWSGRATVERAFMYAFADGAAILLASIWASSATSNPSSFWSFHPKAEIPGHQWYRVALLSVGVILFIYKLFNVKSAVLESEMLLVLKFIFVVAMSLGAWFSSALFHMRSKPEMDIDQEQSLSWLSLAMARISRAFAVSFGLLGLLGYLNAALFALSGFLSSLVLFLAVLNLQGPLTILAARLTKEKLCDIRDSMTAVYILLISFLLTFPLFAVSWGANSSSLADFMFALRRGWLINGLRISLTSIIVSLTVFFVILFLVKALIKVLQGVVFPRSKIDKGTKSSLEDFTKYCGFFIAVLVAANAGGFDLGSLAIFAGAVSIAIGFGAREVVQNFVAGIILLFERPVSEGDWVQIGDQFGVIRDISVRSTRIESLSKSEVIIPNIEIISKRVTKLADGAHAGPINLDITHSDQLTSEALRFALERAIEFRPDIFSEPKPTIEQWVDKSGRHHAKLTLLLRDLNAQSDTRFELRLRIAEEIKRLDAASI